MTETLTTPTQSTRWPFWTEPSFVDVRGTRIAYRRGGSGPTLVYLHGAGLTQRWLPFYDRLAEHFDVLVAEHPGFGDSDLPDWLTTIEDVVIHYAELFDILGVGPTHIVGHSLGGWIAAEFAAFYPERVRSLTLIAPVGLRGSFKIDSFRMEGDAALNVLFNGHHDLYPDYLEEGDPTEAVVQGYREKITQARLMWNPRYDLKLECRLGRVGVPARVVIPEDDRLVDGTTMRRYADLLPNATTVTLSGGGDDPVGHLAIVQRPAQLVAIIQDLATHSVSTAHTASTATEA